VGRRVVGVGSAKKYSHGAEELLKGIGRGALRPYGPHPMPQYTCTASARRSEGSQLTTHHVYFNHVYMQFL
jgi:hypothetical protein